MKTLNFLMIICCIISLGLLTGCAKSHTKFTVLGFDMVIDDSEPAGEINEEA